MSSPAETRPASPMPLPTTLEEIRTYVRQTGSSSSSRSSWTCTASRTRSSCRRAHLDDLLTEGAGFAGFAAGDIGQVPSDPDMIAMPDLRSLTPLPWRPEVARFACDVQVEGEPWPYCPRTILRRQLDRAKALGYEFKIGIELEYFLVRRLEDGALELADQLDTLDQPCYDMRALTRNLDFVGQVARNLNALGWDNYATDHEDANGQFEQNFDYADALTTCDRAIFFRYMVEAMAQERGLIATFMPKPFAAPDRQRLPLPHEPVEGRRERLRRRPLRGPARHRPLAGRLPLPRRPQGARAGLHRADRADGHLLQAPRGRLAQRRDVGAGVTSATATTTAPRCCAIPAPGRIEDRTVDGSCNPYLAATAILAAGLDGIERELRPRRADDGAQPPRGRRGRALHERGHRAAAGQPARRHAGARARRRAARGARHHARARTTWTTSSTSSATSGSQAHEQITQWELDRYLQLYCAVRRRPARRDRAARARSRPRLETSALRGRSGLVASSPDLDHVLDGIVDLLTEATDCHACFVYLRDGDRLRLRAASRSTRHLVGRLELGVDEGLTGWVARHPGRRSSATRRCRTRA